MLSKNSASCHCGQNKISINSDMGPSWVGACHCNDCKKISGSAYMIYALFKKSGIEFSSKNILEYQSSENVTRSFCKSCGSPISFVYNNKKDDIFLTVGLSDKPDIFKIQKHIFVNRKMSHVILEELTEKEM